MKKRDIIGISIAGGLCILLGITSMAKRPPRATTRQLSKARTAALALCHDQFRGKLVPCASAHPATGGPAMTQQHTNFHSNVFNLWWVQIVIHHAHS